MIAIIAQLLIIVVLLAKIHKRNNVLGQSINVINKNSIQRPSDQKYKYFYEPKPNTQETVNVDWATDNPPIYTINNDALNELHNYTIEKPDNIFRIITIGDSFTFGYNLSTEDNWTEVLEKRLNEIPTCKNRYEVINLGVHGYDTAYQVERYRIRGQKYNPDLIIWFVTDLQRITDKYRDIFKKKGLDESKVESWRIASSELLKRYGQDGLMNYQVEKFNEFREKYYPNRPLLIIGDLDVTYNLGKKNPFNIYYSDTNVFDNKDNFLPDGHFNKLGNIEFMEEVFSYLSSNDLIPCQ